MTKRTNPQHLAAYMQPLRKASQQQAPKPDIQIGYLVTYSDDSANPELYESLSKALSVVEYAMGFDDCHTVTIERVQHREVQP